MKGGEERKGNKEGRKGRGIEMAILYWGKKKTVFKKKLKCLACYQEEQIFLEPCK